MPTIKITQLFSYPIKSTTGNQLDQADYTATGFRWDRAFAIINQVNQIITVRECQNLLKLKSHVVGQLLKFEARNGDTYELDFKETNSTHLDVGIFSDTASAKVFDDEVNAFLSNIIEQPGRLIMINEEKLRIISPQYFDAYDAKTHFCDLAPIHIISEESIADLNNKLDVPVTAAHFRPNIVISGVQAFEEDQWQEITINGMVFTVFHKTSRCVLTTVDPQTLEKSPRSEPLKTMASYRTQNNKVKFGIYLIPMSGGSVCIGDEIVVSQRH